VRDPLVAAAYKALRQSSNDAEASVCAASAERKRRQASELGLAWPPPTDRRQLYHRAVYEAIETNTLPGGVLLNPPPTWKVGMPLGEDAHAVVVEDALRAEAGRASVGKGRSEDDKGEGAKSTRAYHKLPDEHNPKCFFFVLRAHIAPAHRNTPICQAPTPHRPQLSLWDWLDDEALVMPIPLVGARGEQLMLLDVMFSV